MHTIPPLHHEVQECFFRPLEGARRRAATTRLRATLVSEQERLREDGRRPAMLGKSKRRRGHAGTSTAALKPLLIHLFSSTDFLLRQAIHGFAPDALF